MRTRSKSKPLAVEASPFGEVSRPNKTISLWMLMFSLVVFAGISMVIMFAARVPIIANSINDFMGLPHTTKPDKPDRTTHLVFLLFCYSSPLLFAMWLGLLQSFFVNFISRPNVHMQSREGDDPFA